MKIIEKTFIYRLSKNTYKRTLKEHILVQMKKNNLFLRNLKKKTKKNSEELINIIKMLVLQKFLKDKYYIHMHFNKIQYIFQEKHLILCIRQFIYIIYREKTYIKKKYCLQRY